jgi:uncharacterized protein (TIGR03083 family)
MDAAEHVDFLEREGELLATAATDIDPDVPVATVPDQSLRELVWHIGGIHRWATATIRERRTERYNTPLLDVVGRWPDDADLVDWFREGHAALLTTLRDADPSLEIWHFFKAPTPIAFWSRRQAHETAIHRADAESCNGMITPYAPEFATDGIDEVLFGFAARRGHFPPIEPPPTLALRAADVGDEWLLQLGPERVAVLDRDGADGDPDCTVRGPASDLYLLIWNRIPPESLEVSGDPEIPAIWRDAIRVRCSE